MISVNSVCRLGGTREVEESDGSMGIAIREWERTRPLFRAEGLRRKERTPTHVDLQGRLDQDTLHRSCRLLALPKKGRRTSSYNGVYAGE